MATRTAVPSDLEPDSVVDLAADCREVTGRLPQPSAPPESARGALAVDIDPRTAAALEGLSAYGA